MVMTVGRRYGPTPCIGMFMQLPLSWCAGGPPFRRMSGHAICWRTISACGCDPARELLIGDLVPKKCGANVINRTFWCLTWVPCQFLSIRLPTPPIWPGATEAACGSCLGAARSASKYGKVKKNIARRSRRGPPLQIPFGDAAANQKCGRRSRAAKSWPFQKPELLSPACQAQRGGYL